MDALISTFHLDIKLLIAQVVNFGIVFLILYYFVFRPLFKVMGDRSNTIEKSLQEAKEIEERLEKTKSQQAELLRQAKTDAAAVLEEANRQAEEKKQAVVMRAKEEIGELINREKAKIQADKSEALRQIREEVGGMIAAGLEKVLAEKLDKTSDEKLIAKAVKQLD